MPLELGSSVDTISTARAQRMHRSTSTWTTGRWTESMLCRYELPPDELDRSESDAEYDDDDRILLWCFLDGRCEREDMLAVVPWSLVRGEEAAAATTRSGACHPGLACGSSDNGGLDLFSETRTRDERFL